ncbi:hypothetical protein [Psychrobium sp. 1_MG-2023]|uniref:PKD domain-containing protein n=1 Tax=Psychrobium sp. 1_MG-2023 TaxID=3062624 RepID=UPI00273539A8|nr:hypothetical protein [Psychrobium sp. 1_MG-2023]MDP2560630.1 hypothetical protein [Psychrobium sp. 1_MG-2023]
MLNKKISLYYLISALFLSFFLISCGGGGDSKKSTTDPNNAPTVEIIGSKTVQERNNFSLTAQATDSDGSISSYLWSVTSDKKVTLSGKTSATVSFQAIDVNADTPIELKVVVTDNDGASATKSHTVTILRKSSELTLTGSVTDNPIANASVLITVGTESFSTIADAVGDYSIMIDVDEDNTDKLVLLKATGASDSHPGVVLVSQLPTFNSLATLAGTGSEIDSSNFFGLNITNVTTAQLALIHRNLSGNNLESEEQLNQLLAMVDAQEQLTIAALIKIIIDNPLFTLPDGAQDTFALVLDETLKQNFEDLVIIQDSALISKTVSEIINDESLVSIGEGRDFDNDSVLDTDDAFPFDSTESVDSDKDGVGNNADDDDDNDKVLDVNDAFPTDATESVDTDKDGIGNNADKDDDNDKVLDTNDAFPTDATESVDTDKDGTGNNADPDDDNDKVLDENDAFPLISVEGLVDTDADGRPDDCDQACIDLGLAADDDDDGDGILDVDEIPPVINVAINTPKSLTTVGTSTITVSGTAVPADATLTLNGTTVTNNSGNFSSEVTLTEGSNTIEVKATKGNLIQTDIVTISLDQTPPFLTIDSHKDGDTVFTNTVTITGLVNDIVRGTIEEDQANVTVNGIDTTISNRSYAAANVPLIEGENTITVNGADQVGNVSSIDIKLNYEVIVGKRVELSRGQQQTGVIKTELAEPLEVRVLNDDNELVQDAAVVFRVSQGSGAVGAGTDNEGRAVVVETDVNGIASTRFKVGARAGVSNHKVTAAVVGYVSQVDFSASASGEIGNKLSVNSGNNQRGSVGNNLPEPLVVVVTDAGANVVANSRVKFDVTVGEGLLSNDLQSYEVQTDSDGRASTLFKLSSLTGIDAQRVVATLVDAPEGKVITAGFSATAFIPAEAGLTKVSGVVLDNQEEPIPGVTLRIEGSNREAISDSSGQFTIEQAPIGPLHIIADGSTATNEGEYPSLSFNLVTISGVDNPLPSPIYMVKLDTENAVYAGLADTVLELKEYPGFKLEIAKDSVTFPNGDKEGYISVTPVNAGTVPMAPPNGMQPKFIVTIQPTGTKFSPPAKLTLPNVDAHEPGAQVEMYSFDHDLEEFVAIGLGTVSEDGTLVTTNPGVGVIKAGWHCGSQPGGQSCAHNCPICQDCDGDCNCVPASGDPRLASLNKVGDCKKAECSDGGVVTVNDNADAPEDDKVGDCKKFSCEDGSPVKVTDNTDETKCTTCGEDGPEAKPDGHVPDDDKCIICQDGKETKKPDNELGGTTITFNGMKNLIADINKLLTLLGSNKKLPEVSLEYSNTKKEVCCTQRDGATTLEETDSGTAAISKWDNEWIPTIPPFSGDYTVRVFGKEIGVKYGIRFTFGVSGKLTISRVKKECEDKNCWGGSVTIDIGVGGGPFGSVPNPASSPISCGPDGKKRPCDIIRIQGTVKTGVNAQASVDCTAIKGTIGHNGISLNAEIVVAEGSWVEIGASESWVVANSASVAIINIPMPE